jgi:hypothetical protein
MESPKGKRRMYLKLYFTIMEHTIKNQHLCFNSSWVPTHTYTKNSIYNTRNTVNKTNLESHNKHGHTNTYTHMRSSLRTLHAYEHIHIRPHTCEHIHMNTYTHMQSSLRTLHTYEHIHIRSHTCEHIHIRPHTCEHIHIRPHTCEHIHIRPHTCEHIHMNTNTHMRSSL